MILGNVESIEYLDVTTINDLLLIFPVFPQNSRILEKDLCSCPPDLKEAAYKGLVRPVLEYGIKIKRTEFL